MLERTASSATSGADEEARFESQGSVIAGDSFEDHGLLAESPVKEAPPLPPPPVLIQKEELTAEELEHIERVRRLAEGLEMTSTYVEEPEIKEAEPEFREAEPDFKEAEPMLERTASSATSGGDEEARFESQGSVIAGDSFEDHGLLAESPVKEAPPLPPPPVLIQKEELTAEELEHIERVRRLAEGLEMTSTYVEEPEIKEAEPMLERTASSATSGADEGARFESQGSVIAGDSFEDHGLLAESPVKEAPPLPPPPVLIQKEELTAEDLEHIERVRRLAEGLEMTSTYVEEPEIKEAEPMLERTASSATSGADEEARFESQGSVIAGDSFEDHGLLAESPVKEAPPLPPPPVLIQKEELTAEELEHIERVRRLAEGLEMTSTYVEEPEIREAEPEFREAEPEFKEAEPMLERTASSATSGGDEEARFESQGSVIAGDSFEDHGLLAESPVKEAPPLPPPPVLIQKEELTAEELEHIERVRRLAEGLEMTSTYVEEPEIREAEPEFREAEPEFKEAEPMLERTASSATSGGDEEARFESQGSVIAGDSFEDHGLLAESPVKEAPPLPPPPVLIQKEELTAEELEHIERVRRLAEGLEMTSTYVEEPEIKEAEPEFREAEPDFKEAEPMLERTASSATSGADEEARFESQGSVIAGDSFEDHGLLAESPVKEAPPLPPPPVLIQKEELTAEELEHIERVRRLAEGLEMTSTYVEEPEIREAEPEFREAEPEFKEAEPMLERTASSATSGGDEEARFESQGSVIAGDSFEDHGLLAESPVKEAPPLPPPPVLIQKEELTAEELEHIERVRRLAEGLEMTSTYVEEPEIREAEPEFREAEPEFKEAEPMLERTASSATSGGDEEARFESQGSVIAGDSFEDHGLLAESPVKEAPPLPPPPVLIQKEELTAEELEHIERVRRLAEGLEMTSTYVEEPEIKEAEPEFREAEPDFKEAEPMLERTASSATSGADEEARFESQGSVIAGDSFEDHGLLAESPVKEAPPLPPLPVLIQKEELTAEELEHIERVRRLAEGLEMTSTYVEEPEIREAEPMLERTASSATSGADEEARFESQGSVIAGDSFEDHGLLAESPVKEAPPLPPPPVLIQKEELTAEELEHIERVRRLAEGLEMTSTYVEEPEIREAEPMLERTASSATSGADEEARFESQGSVIAGDSFEDHGLLAESPVKEAPPLPPPPVLIQKEELTAEELEHIERVRRLAEGLEMTSTYVEEPEIKEAEPEFREAEPDFKEAEPMLERTASSATSGGDEEARFESQGSVIAGDSFEDHGLLAESPVKEAPPLPPPPVLIQKEELTAEELEHIERVRRLAEGLEMTSTYVEEPEIREAEPEFREAEPEFKEAEPMLERTASSATSGGDEEARFESQGSVIAGDSFEDHGLLAESPVKEAPPLPPPPVLIQKEELTAEELEHIERVRRLAEGLEMTSTYVEEPEIREAEPMLERTASSATSGADEEARFESQGSVIAGDSFEDHGLLAESPVKEAPPLPPPPVLIQKEELTAEELEHIERVRRLAEGLEMTSTYVEEPEIKEAEPEFREAEPDFKEAEPMLERTASSATSGGDEEARFESQGSVIAGDSFEDHGLLAESPVKEAPPLPPPPVLIQKEELTAEELEHIERVRRLAEGLEMTSTYVEEPEIKEAEPMLERTASSATSGADEGARFESQGSVIAGDSFEDHGLLAESPVKEAPPLPPPPVLIQKEELTAEELEHIERVRRLAEGLEMTSTYVEEPEIKEAEPMLERTASSATSGADEEARFESQGSVIAGDSFEDHGLLAESPVKEAPPLPPLPVLIQKEELTAEELEHIERVRRLAEGLEMTSTYVEEPEIKEAEPMLERTASSATSGADEEARFESQGSVIAGDSFEDHGLLAESPVKEAPPLPPLPVLIQKEELTAEELEHIERVRRLAEGLEMTSTYVEEPEIKEAEPMLERTASSATSGADEEARFESQGSVIAGDSFEDHGLLAESPVKEAPPLPPLPVLIQKEELTAEELEHIERVRRLAEGLEMTSTYVEEPEIREAEPEFREAEPEFKEAEPEFKEAEPMLERTSSSATSGADEEAGFESQGSVIAGDSFEDHGLLAESPVKEAPPLPPLPVLIQKEELTAEELEHIERVRRLAEGLEMTSTYVEEPEIREAEPEFREAEPEFKKAEPNLERTASSATSGADEEARFESQGSVIAGDSFEDHGLLAESPVKEAPPLPPPPVLIQKEELTAEDLEHIERVRRLAEGLEMTSTYVEEPEIKEAEPMLERTASSATSGADEFVNSSVLTNDVYRKTSTNSLNEMTTVSYTNKLIKSLPLKERLSLSLEGKHVKKIDYQQKKSCSVNVIYTDKKLSTESIFDNSHCKIDLPKVVVENNGLNAYEHCEHTSGRDGTGQLNNVDFLAKLNFMCQRITENIAEAAADDLLRIIRLKSNPRFRYFEEGYISQLLDVDDEGVSSPESVTSEESDKPLQYNVEPVIEKPGKTGFDLFGLFRQKPPERPVSAMAFLRRQPSPVFTPRKSSVRSGDIMDLVRRSSFTSETHNDSLPNVPEEALQGLTAEEREHIIQVMMNASKSITPEPSRRCSSALIGLPELDDLDESEKKHIESVVEKADSRDMPFVLNKKKDDTSGIKTETAKEKTVATPELSREELYHIAQIEQKIKELGMLDNKTQKDVVTDQGMFKKFNFNDMLSKQTQKINKIVQSNVPALSSPVTSKKQEEEIIVQKAYTEDVVNESQPKLYSPTYTTIRTTKQFTEVITVPELEETITIEEIDATWLQENIEELNKTIDMYTYQENLEDQDFSEEDVNILETQDFGNVIQGNDDFVLANQTKSWEADRPNEASEIIDPEEQHEEQRLRSQFVQPVAFQSTFESGKKTSVKYNENAVLSGRALSPSLTEDPRGRVYANQGQSCSVSDQKENSEGFSPLFKEKPYVAELGTAWPAEEPISDIANGKGEDEVTNDNDSKPQHQSTNQTESTSTTLRPAKEVMSFGKSSSGFGGFGGFGKLASGALKSAKQATEQISVKASQAAQVAQQAASTGDLTQVGVGSFLSKKETPERSKSAIDFNKQPDVPAVVQDIPPGLENLSEEERMKIMAVMACAEIDTQAPAPPPKVVQSTPPSKVEKPPIALPAKTKQPKMPQKVEQPKPTSQQDKVAQAQNKTIPSPQPVDTPPGVDEEMLQGLSPAEREQILRVMRMAEQEEPVAPIITPKKQSMSAETSVENEDYPIPQKSISFTSVTESGYVTAPSTSYSTELSTYSPEQTQVLIIQKPALDSNELNYTNEKAEPTQGFEKRLTTTESAKSLSEIDAVETDDSFWIEPQEYKVPDAWEPNKSGRMWTTVFSDDGDIAATEYDSEVSIIETDENEKNKNIIQPPRPVTEQIVTTSLESDDGSHHLHEFNDGSFEVQMEDPLSPTVIVSMVASNNVNNVTTGFSKMMEVTKTPEIKITSHEEIEKTSDDESDAETPPSSDEDDYPDRVIEVPSVSALQLVEDQKTQSKSTEEVLKQIQSFGEAADDEFDVQWAANITKKKEINETEAPSGATEPLKTTEPTTNQRINPFIDSPEDEENDVVVEQVHLDSDDIDYQHAVHYYTSRHDGYHKHRPGPVYTIPEGDENNSSVSSESKYNPQLLERRPLHGTTVPPLVPKDVKRKGKPEPIQKYSESEPIIENGKVPITPIRTAPPPPDATNGRSTFDNKSGDVKTSATPLQITSQFTTDIHQANDVHLPPHIHIHGTQPKPATNPPSCVAASDAEFLAQFSSNPKEQDKSVADYTYVSLNIDDNQSSKLKRSPAMILTKEEKPIDVLPQKPLPKQWNVDEDALLHGANTEMGRRKLPSLPGNRQQPTSHIPLYYSTNSLTQKDGTGIVAPYYGQLSSSRITSSIAASSEPYLPRTDGSLYTVDPAIMAGATFKPAQKPRPRSAITSTEVGKKFDATPKMSEAMSQLMFKQELRKTLTKRRISQENAEIEANQRQYVIRRMLVSGLMPEHRSSEIESIPDVVKCSLPADLVRGARVTPIKSTSILYATEIPRARQTPIKDQYTQSVSAVPTQKTVGVQYDTTTKKPALTRYYTEQAPPQTKTLPLSMKSQFQPSDQVDSCTQTMISSETQTDSYISTDMETSVKRRIPYHEELSGVGYNSLSNRFTPDLLEKTEKYFDEYDKRLRTSQLPSIKNRTRFTDAKTPEEMEWKRQEVMKELELRKEKVASMIDLRNLHSYDLDDNTLINSMMNQYGSPRQDTTRQTRTNMYNRYGSLPRDFERTNYERTNFDNTPYYPPSNIPGLYSGSAQNLYQQDRYKAPISDRNFNSVNPYCTLPRNNNFQRYSNLSYPSQEQIQCNDAILTQYASYVNDQIDNAGFIDDFNYPTTIRQENILDQPQRPVPDYYSYQQIPNQYATSRVIQQPLMQQTMPTYLQPTTTDYVYSRRDNNYGSRPIQPIGDYGNVLYNRIKLNQPTNDLRNDNTSDPYAAYSMNRPQRTWNTLPSPYALQPSYRSPHIPLNNNFNEPWPCPQYPRSYHYSTQPRPQPQPYQTPGMYQIEPEKYSISLPRYHRSEERRNKKVKSTYSTHNRAQPTSSYHSTRPKSCNKIKRILLTRRYRHANVYHDLGFRVTGGKRLYNGELAAYVTAVNRSKAYETLGEIKEGDQVLEWNGVLLRGKTFEEVERIINATSGEVEIVVKSQDDCRNDNYEQESMYDAAADDSQRRLYKHPPPVPAHKGSMDYKRKRMKSQDGLGKIQIAIGYDQYHSVLVVTVIAARGLTHREYENNIVLPNPFVKIYLLPGRKVVNKRRTKYVSNTCDPEWHQPVDYLVDYNDLFSKYLELTVWDYDKYNDNICLGHIMIPLRHNVLDNAPRWYLLESVDQQLKTEPVTTALYNKSRSFNKANYFYNPSNLDLGYPAI
ncbi:unnamed protein product [Bursaphelenchus okinawaensis]|uniref:Uncharacterized protein n=1 Tax=Bursaphelenchus okinawaensis TaxID=465554 RepID=A0A811KU89_9BILA|nr:unnamed protein product [Bursaphelenchus okinawaensis]CAG9112359.1 unnamed protein product [Bursaphelenchus okinawaensis]